MKEDSAVRMRESCNMKGCKTTSVRTLLLDLSTDFLSFSTRWDVEGSPMMQDYSWHIAPRIAPVRTVLESCLQMYPRKYLLSPMCRMYMSTMAMGSMLSQIILIT